MSYITFDYRCSNCGHEDTRLVKREEMDLQEHCEHYMERLPASPRTHFRFNDRKLKD